MKKLTALFLLLILQVPLFNQWGAVAYYQVNRDFIAKNLCVNKDKPKMNCNGHCYLAKQLKAAEEKETKSNSEKLEKMPELVLFVQKNQVIEILHFDPIKSENNFYYSNFYNFQITSGLAKPPNFSV
ncbi:hypothetical protein EOJ36_07135 [Sandaracinomonas limnophila]|uniref:Secreted protein n=1 Tax=Sandaracinomonas limnophila TaxID=1862386 RepID=A0A437PRC6_9BACT|nr:hypothetical protein [Sandaracinomonas limnophila]RVU24780.1 hypothetical protein EOJ36_07135 [Sandaracinomonas limnophila]